MTLQELGSVGEFVGSFLLLVSIVYLALQVRQNSKTLSNTAFLDAVRDSNSLDFFHAASFDQIKGLPDLGYAQAELVEIVGIATNQARKAEPRENTTQSQSKAGKTVIPY